MGRRDELWDQYVKSKDPVLREKIIVHNIPLVRHVLSRLAIPTLNDETYNDLVSHGILGLIDAVDRFEPDRGWRFSTYATLRIRGHIIDSLRAMDILPRGARKRVKLIDRAISRLRMELCREPREGEVAAAVNLDLKSYRAALLEANCAVYSIDAAIEADDSDESLSLQDMLCDRDTATPEQALEETEIQQGLGTALVQLPQRVQVLLSLYYFEGLTMKEIGQVLELSESRVSQLHARAMKNLRTTLEQNETTSSTPSAMRVPRGAPVPVFAVG